MIDAAEQHSHQEQDQLLTETEPERDAESRIGSRVVSDVDLKDNVSESSKKSQYSRIFAQGFGDSNLKAVAREVQDLSDPVAEWDNMGPASQEEQASLFVEHLKTMNWMFETLKNFDRPVPPSSISSEEYSERTPKVPEMQECTWLEWWDSPPSESAIQVLVEEEPSDSDMLFSPRRPRHSDEGTMDPKPVFLQARIDGIKVLPNRISIDSLPVRRILESLTKGGLSGNHRQIIYRPYKIFQWLEPDLRQKRSEIQDLYRTKFDDESETPDTQNLPRADSCVPEDSEVVTKPPKGAYDRDEIIFTSGFDWKSLTKSELREAGLDLGVLLSFIDKYISPLREALQGGRDFQVHYQELWHVFKPGTTIYVKDPMIPQKLWRVVQGRGGQKPIFRRAGSKTTRFQLGGTLGDTRPSHFFIDCYYLDFDGHRFIRVFKQFWFEWFRELSSVRALPIVPLKIAEREGLVDPQSYKERGEDFISYTKGSYSYYRGQSMIFEPDGTGLRRPERRGAIASVVALSESIESPVIVDFNRCLQEVPDWRPGRLPTSVWRRVENIVQNKRPEDTGPVLAAPPGSDNDSLWDIRLAEEVLNYTDQSKPPEVFGREPPTGDEILLLPARVFGFVLRTRQWGEYMF